MARRASASHELKVGDRTITISNPDKLMYPVARVTKAQVNRGMPARNPRSVGCNYPKVVRMAVSPARAGGTSTTAKPCRA